MSAFELARPQRGSDIARRKGLRQKHRREKRYNEKLVRTSPPQAYQGPSSPFTPTSKTSSPEQDQASTSLQQQLIPTPRANAASAGQQNPRSSITSDFITAFHELDQNGKDLATLMVLLGKAELPKNILLRATQPRRFFNRKGEPDHAPAPDLGPVFTDSQNLESALTQLEVRALIRHDRNLDNLTVHSDLRSHIESAASSYTLHKMQYNASKLVFHTFPADPDTENEL